MPTELSIFKPATSDLVNVVAVVSMKQRCWSRESDHGLPLRARAISSVLSPWAGSNARAPESERPPPHQARG